MGWGSRLTSISGVHEARTSQTSEQDGASVCSALRSGWSESQSHIPATAWCLKGLLLLWANFTFPAVTFHALCCIAGVLLNFSLFQV